MLKKMTTIFLILITTIFTAKTLNASSLEKTLFDFDKDLKKFGKTLNTVSKMQEEAAKKRYEMSGTGKKSFIKEFGSFCYLSILIVCTLVVTACSIISLIENVRESRSRKPSLPRKKHHRKSATAAVEIPIKSLQAQVA